LTFLNGNPINGNRACIGFKFALTEIKVFLYVLLRDLVFTIDADLVIERKVNVVTRPCVKSEPERGNQMPLRVRRFVPNQTSYPPSVSASQISEQSGHWTRTSATSASATKRKNRVPSSSAPGNGIGDGEDLATATSENRHARQFSEFAES